MRNYIKYVFYLFVLIWFSFASAGSQEDFFRAIKRDDAPEILSLLQRGFDANTRDPDNQHGLYIALRESSPKVAKVLVDWPQTDFNAENQNGETPLMMASLKGPIELALEMVRRVDNVNKTGWTPLHYAATTGNIQLINALLEKHAYIDAESPNGTTPLMMAAQYGTAGAVKLLLEEGADPLLKNQLDLTAIDFAQAGLKMDAAEIIAAFVRAKLPKGKW